MNVALVMRSMEASKGIQLRESQQLLTTYCTKGASKPPRRIIVYDSMRPSFAHHEPAAVLSSPLMQGDAAQLEGAPDFEETRQFLRIDDRAT